MLETIILMLSMNLSEPLGAVAGSWLVVAVMLALMTGFWLAALSGLRRQRREVVALQRRLDAMSGDMKALCAGGMGVDQRISYLEKQGRGLEQRQESLETRQDDDQPYGEAIQLVHQGASASKLVSDLGLSYSEAELVVMLHGMDKAS